MKYKEFSQILAEFLKENNLTQTEFARRCNLKQSQVSEWLSGKASPSYHILRTIAIAFEVSSDYLLGLKDNY